MNRLVVIIVLGAFVVFACKKDDPENPYEQIEQIINDNPSADDLPIANFAWLQGKIFKPTCANSGCHDGTFEPEFNNIASSYNSLVNHSVITNDESNSFEYRVVPGNSSASLLIERMEVFIPNTSGIMPLEVEPGSDYIENSQYYIDKIKEWINNGAQDMYGNAPPGVGADFPPVADGFVVFPTGNTDTPYIRDPEQVGISPILIEATAIDLWLRVSDDNTPASAMANNEVKLSMDIDGFDAETPYPYSVESPITALDFADGTAEFYHRATVDLSSANSGDIFFVRNYLDDGVQSSVTEIPNPGSNQSITALFVLEVQ